MNILILLVCRMNMLFTLMISVPFFIFSKYGKALYLAGKPYNQFAKTINTLTAKKLALRRLMQGAWHVAFSWLHEPGPHHAAMPWQVLLAMIVVSLIWGASALALAGARFVDLARSFLLEGLTSCFHEMLTIQLFLDCSLSRSLK